MLSTTNTTTTPANAFFSLLDVYVAFLLLLRIVFPTSGQMKRPGTWFEGKMRYAFPNVCVRFCPVFSIAPSTICAAATHFLRTHLVPGTNDQRKFRKTSQKISGKNLLGWFYFCSVKRIISCSYALVI